jgi:hypothetical protein
LCMSYLKPIKLNMRIKYKIVHDFMFIHYCLVYVVHVDIVSFRNLNVYFVFFLSILIKVLLPQSYVTIVELGYLLGLNRILK